MLRVPGRRIDCFLQIHLAVNVSEKKLRRPLVLLVAAGRPPSQIRLAVARGQRRAECRTGAFAGGETGGMILVKPKRLGTGPQPETELGNDGGRLQPAARWRRR